MEADPRMVFEPFTNGRCLVGADVVEHDRKLAFRIGPLDLSQEGEEVRGRVAGTGLRGDLAGGDFESSKEVSGAVALLVVGMALDLTGLHRQHRCRSVQSLDLGLLIDAEDNSGWAAPDFLCPALIRASSPETPTSARYRRRRELVDAGKQRLPGGFEGHNALFLEPVPKLNHVHANLGEARQELLVLAHGAGGHRPG